MECAGAGRRELCRSRGPRRSWIAELDADTFAVSHGAATRILRGLFAGLSWQQMSDLDEPQGVVFRVARQHGRGGYDPLRIDGFAAQFLQTRMSHNTFGHLFRVTTFGESHGPAIGCVVDGCPPGIALTEADIQS